MLSVAEAELIALTCCIQEMIYVQELIESMGLFMELPMMIDVDNKGAKDLANNGSIGGRTQHFGVRLNFFRELKEDNIIKVNWIRSEDNTADISTKNLPAAIFQKHVKNLGIRNWNLKRKDRRCSGRV
jgi:hypothetical protein